MAQEFKEKTITISLRKAFMKPATKRAISAKNMLKAGVTKETRLSDVSISNKVNELIWANGKYNTPRKMTIKVVNEKGRAIVLLPSEKYEPKADQKKKEAKKEEKAKEKAESKGETKKETKAPETKKPAAPETRATEKKDAPAKEHKAEGK